MTATNSIHIMYMGLLRKDVELDESMSIATSSTAQRFHHFYIPMLSLILSTPCNPHMMLINNPLSLSVPPPPPPFLSMANNLSLCLVGAMDRLWFQQIILFPEPFSPYFPLEPKQPLSESTTTSSSSSTLSLSSVADQEKPALVNNNNKKRMKKSYAHQVQHS